MPEATSLLVFTLVAGLLWYALARTGGDVAAASSGTILPIDARSGDTGSAGLAPAAVTNKQP